MNLFSASLTQASFFFWLCIFSSEIEQAEFQYKCQITSLCARKPNIVFIDLSWILNLPVTIVTYLKKSIECFRLSFFNNTVALDFVFLCLDDNVHVVNLWMSGWKSERLYAGLLLRTDSRECCPGSWDMRLVTKIPAMALPVGLMWSFMAWKYSVCGLNTAQ